MTHDELRLREISIDIAMLDQEHEKIKDCVACISQAQNHLADYIEQLGEKACDTTG